MVGLGPEGPGGTLWERVRLCGARWRLCVPGFVFAGPLGRRRVRWGGCALAAQPVSLPPIGRALCRPPSRGQNSPDTCSLRPWPRVEGTWPEPGQPDASTGARCLECASQRSGERLEFLPCSGRGSLQRPEPTEPQARSPRLGLDSVGLPVSF